MREARIVGRVKGEAGGRERTREAYGRYASGDTGGGGWMGNRYERSRARWILYQSTSGCEHLLSETDGLAVNKTSSVTKRISSMLPVAQLKYGCDIHPTRIDDSLFSIHRINHSIPLIGFSN